MVGAALTPPLGAFDRCVRVESITIVRASGRFPSFDLMGRASEQQRTGGASLNQMLANSSRIVGGVTVMVAAVAVSCFTPVDEKRAHEAVIGPEGGRVVTADGMAVDIAPGALASPTVITIRRTVASGRVPGSQLGAAWELGPEGLQFSTAVRVELPLDDEVPANAQVWIATAPGGSSDYTLLPATTDGITVIAETLHFSVFVPTSTPEDGGHGSDAGAPPTEDSGLSTPPADGGTFDASTPDAGIADAGPGTCSPSSGTCFDTGMGNFDGGCATKTSCSDGTAKYLQCIDGVCSCALSPGPPSGTFKTFAAPKNACDKTVFEDLWRCGCGFPVRGAPDAGSDLCVPPGTVTGDVDGGRPYGASCEDGITGEKCASNFCFNTASHGRICSSPCPGFSACPCGYRCIQYYPSDDGWACIP